MRRPQFFSGGSGSARGGSAAQHARGSSGVTGRACGGGLGGGDGGCRNPPDAQPRPEVGRALPPRRRGRGPRGDLSDDDDSDEPLEREVLEWPSEPSREERPLVLLRDVASDAAAWEQVVGDEWLRSWMFVRRGCEAITSDDLDTLMRDVEWRDLTNGTGKLTRKTAWLVSGRCRCAYRYGNEEVEPEVMPTWFCEMAERWFGDMAQGPEGMPNCVNLNLYEDGAHGVGWHADDESLFGGRVRDCAIISVSLGEARRFRVGLRIGRRGKRLVADPVSIRDVELGHGDLCTMEGRFQKHFIHSISRCRKAAVGPRVNATFRWIRRHGPECPLRPPPPPRPAPRPGTAARRGPPVKRRGGGDSGESPGLGGGGAKAGALALYDPATGQLTSLGLTLFAVVALCAWSTTFWL